MATNPISGQKKTEAKLFMSGRSQAVRLPKEFRFEGDRVRVTRVGAGVLLEPMPAVETEAVQETVEGWFARIDAIEGDPLFPEGRKQKLAPASAEHDIWFRAKVQEALDDSRSALPNEAVKLHFAQKRAAALDEKAR